MSSPKYRQPRWPRLKSTGIARGVVAFQTGDNLRGFTHSSTPVVVNTAEGRAQSFTASAAYKSIPSFSTRAASTLAVVFKPAAIGATEVLVSVGDADVDVLYITPSGVLEFSDNSPGITGTTTVSAGKWSSAAIVKRQTTGDIWLNGVKDVTGALYNTFNVTKFGVGGFFLGGTLHPTRYTGEIALAVSWNRALSDSELREFFKDPWQLFHREVEEYYADLSASTYNFSPANGQANSSILVPTYRFGVSSGQATVSVLSPSGVSNFISASGTSTTSVLSPPTSLAWDAPGSWNSNPTSPCSYTSEIKDLGTVLTGQVDVPVIDCDGAEVIEIRSSVDNITFTPYSTPSASFTGRYIQIRVTLTATGGEPVPALRELQWQVSADLKREYLDDLEPSDFAGAYRIGTGDIRVQTSNTYTVIKTMIPTVQDPTGATWDAPVLIDKNVSLGWRWQFRKAGVLSDPPFVDFYIEGI